MSSIISEKDFDSIAKLAEFSQRDQNDLIELCARYVNINETIEANRAYIENTNDKPQFAHLIDRALVLIDQQENMASEVADEIARILDDHADEHRLCEYYGSVILV